MNIARRAVLQNRDLRRFLLARFLATVAVQMQTVAVGWQVYAVTRDPLDLGLVGLSQFLPFVALIFPAGHAADSRDRRRVLAACFGLEGVCALLLLGFAWRGLSSAVPVFGVMLLFGAARAFAMPAGQALLPNLVTRPQLGTAVALNSSTWQIATIAGPAAGGLLYLLGPVTVYASVAVLLFLAMLLLLGLERGGSAARSATALLPVYAADVLQVGPGGLGVLRTAPAVGAAACGLLLGARPIATRVGHWMFGGVIVFGLATVVFGVSTSFWLSLAALTAMGAGDMVSVYIRHVLVQLETPDDIRGRVSAVNAVFIGASNEMGEFESGVTAAWFGTVPAVVIGGLATLGVAWLWARRFPELWRMDRFPEPPA